MAAVTIMRTRVTITEQAKPNISIHLIMDNDNNPARALRALGLLLADGAPTVGGGKTF